MARAATLTATAGEERKGVTDSRAARRRRGRLDPWYRVAVLLLRRPLMLLTRRDWHGAEHIPDGGAVAVTNHLSHFDPLSFAHFLYDAGRLPRFLGKASLFSVPVVGTILRGAGQIPVYRESEDAAKAYSAAVDAVRAGELVAIYPEATLTRDPDLWPMAGKTGAARIALETGAPVVPVAQWGPQLVLPPYGRMPRLLPRRTMHLRAGPPVDVSDLVGRPVDAALLAEATERIMAAITGLLEDIRGDRAPAVRFDPRQHDLPAVGDPRRGAGPSDRRSA